MIVPLLTEQHCLEWQMCSFHQICRLALHRLVLVVHEHGGICHIVSLSLVCTCYPPHGTYSGQANLEQVLVLKLEKENEDVDPLAIEQASDYRTEEV